MPFITAGRTLTCRAAVVGIVQSWEVVMSVPLRIVTLFGGLLFIALGVGIVLPPLFDVLNDPNPLDSFGGTVTVVVMLLFFGAAPAFVGVRLIQRAIRTGPGAVAMEPQLDMAPAIVETPAPAHVRASGATTIDEVDQSPVALAPSYDAAPPPPPSARRAPEAEPTRAAATSERGAQARSWSTRLLALVRTPRGLAIALAVIAIPLMILLRPSGAYVGTLALVVYSVVAIGDSAVHKSWLISALMSAGIGMMLFIVLAVTAGALERGEGNNPVFIIPGLLFYAGVGLTGITRLVWRR